MAGETLHELPPDGQGERRGPPSLLQGASFDELRVRGYKKFLSCVLALPILNDVS